MHNLCPIIAFSLSVAVLGVERPKTVPAWQNTVDKSAAEAAMCAYTSNVIRCEWAGENPRIASLMPANLAFQFAVVGDSDVTNRVQKMLNEVADSFNPALRKELENHRLLNSSLQWLFRLSRPGATNVQHYINAWNHPAAFRESDFDVKLLKSYASRLTMDQIPLPVAVTLKYGEDMSPLGKAHAGIDYSDVLPEETFTLPFGCALVVRAPERRRKIRLSAATWPSAAASEYVWRATGGARVIPHTADIYERPIYDLVDVVYDVASCRPRIDIMVWAKFGKDIHGPPTVISIYNVPYEQRRYGKKGIDSITCVRSSPNVPYDISPIWIPHEWQDVFEHSSSGQIVSFERIEPGRVKGDVFSATGEIVHSMSSSGFPLAVSKVEYFICPDSGVLKYREVGEEITYKLGFHPVRRSGE